MWIHLIRIEGGIIDQLRSGHVRGTSGAGQIFHFLLNLKYPFKLLVLVRWMKGHFNLKMAQNKKILCCLKDTDVFKFFEKSKFFEKMASEQEYILSFKKYNC